MNERTVLNPLVPVIGTKKDQQFSPMCVVYCWMILSAKILKIIGEGLAFNLFFTEENQ